MGKRLTLELGRGCRLSVVYKIGQLAELTGVSRDTLRYYENRRLLRQPNRTESGYRIYGSDAVSRVRFIKRARGLGFTLDEIRVIVEISDGGRPPCHHVDRYSARRLRSSTHN
jgi:DNA-binding transcriptional MerR regulator